MSRMRPPRPPAVLKSRVLTEAYVVALENENEALRSRVAVLEGAYDMVRIVFGVTAVQGAILSLLIRRGQASREQLMTVIHRDIRRIGPDPRTLDVHIVRLRRVLKNFDIVIETVWGSGYKLGSESRARALALLGEAGGRDGTLHEYAAGPGRLHAAVAGS